MKNPCVLSGYYFSFPMRLINSKIGGNSKYRNLPPNILVNDIKQTTSTEPFMERILLPYPVDSECFIKSFSTFRWWRTNLLPYQFLFAHPSTG